MSTTSEEKYVVETINIFGSPVFLTEDTWQTHIVTEHPCMAGMEKKVKKALETPDVVYKDPDFESTQNYNLKHNSVKLNSFGQYLKVAVDADLGRVKTAYTLEEYKQEGDLIYKKIDI